jgi:DnaJ-class molecular chaperone
MPEFDYYDEPEFDSVEDQALEDLINGVGDDICRACDGAGEVHGQLCKTCQGTGRV